MNAADRSRLHAAIVQFADGDRAAFREVFDGLWPVLLSFATRTLRDTADSEDAAQRAILKVFDRIVDFDGARDGVSWALAIAAFEVLTTRKQRTRRREEAGEYNIEDDRPIASEVLIAEELRASIREIVGEMSERDREALELALSDVTPRGETERKRRFRAIERLRAAWRKAHG